ncbi:MAG: MFS transporter [Novosphingobium sp.]
MRERMGAPEAADRRFLALYALAWAGSTVAYVPFLTLLLPMHVARLAGSDAVRWLALTTFAGAIFASLCGIAFGWLSDLAGRRRPFVLGGLLLSGLMLQAAPRVETLGAILAVIVAWQIGLNLMLGPLSAWAGDQVPDGRKGLLGGLLAFAPASGALVGALVTLPLFSGLEARFAAVGVIVCLMVLPIVIFGRDGAHPAAGPSEGARAAPSGRMLRAVLSGMATRMWFARLMVQLAEASLFAFFYLWLRTVDARLGDAAIARVLMAAMLAGALTALLAGRWADRHGRPVAPLVAASAGAATGLAIMALAQGPTAAIGGYIVFGISTAVFLGLHTAHTLRVLPDSRRRGRDLGLFNLTNTIPSLIVPSLTLALVPSLGFAGLFAVLALLALGAMALLRERPA